jgi:hypothetical protein
VTNIFWLTTFALLAEESAGWAVVDDFGLDEFLPAKWNAAINATKASAGLGALNWALFIVTLVTFGTSFFHFPVQRHKLTEFFLSRYLPPQAPPRTRRQRLELRRQQTRHRRGEGQHSRHYATR